MKYKICVKCKVKKKLCAFSKLTTTKGGRQSYCRECNNKYAKKYTRTRKGLISKMYKIQKSSSKRRGHNPPQYTREELQEWTYNQPNFEELYKNWVKSNYDKWHIPSIYRLDRNKGYSFDNIRLVTWRENLDKTYADIKSGKYTKVCSKCNILKPIEEFNKNTNTKDGRTGWCKECVSDYNKKYYESKLKGKRDEKSETTYSINISVLSTR